MWLEQSYSSVAVLLEIRHYHTVINIKASIIFDELLFTLTGRTSCTNKSISIYTSPSQTPKPPPLSLSLNLANAEGHPHRAGICLKYILLRRQVLIHE